jgi:hypothetical protein
MDVGRGKKPPNDDVGFCPDFSDHAIQSDDGAGRTESRMSTQAQQLLPDVVAWDMEFGQSTWTLSLKRMLWRQKGLVDKVSERFRSVRSWRNAKEKALLTLSILLNLAEAPRTSI